MNRICSFTEYGLLNRFALNLFSPSHFQKLYISAEGKDSALEILRTTIQNIYSNSKNRSLWHYADQYYLLTPLKLAYVSAVTLTLSRIGTVVNGCLTVYAYARYQFANRSDSKEAWNRTRNYAQAFFSDAVCAIAGAFLTKAVVDFTLGALYFCRMSSLLGKCNYSRQHTIIFTAMSVAIVAFCSMCLITLQHPDIAAQFFAKYEDRVGMYLSLMLRKNLGLFNQNGGLLPFSQKDKINYSSGNGRIFHWEGTNYDTLISQLINAEFELIETVQRCNQHLPEAQKILFQYPFNGEQIANRLENALRSGRNENPALVLHNPNSLATLISKLRSLQLKIELSREIFNTARKLTVEDSFPILIIKQALNQPTITLKLDEPRSYIEEGQYREYFRFGFAGPGPQVDLPENFSAFWKAIELAPINPTTPRPRDGNLFVQFKYDMGVNKWCCQNAQPPKSFREMLGLEANTPHQEYMRIKRRYMAALHPDLNPSDPVRIKAFQCLGFMIEKLNDEYNIPNPKFVPVEPQVYPR